MFERESMQIWTHYCVMRIILAQDTNHPLHLVWYNVIGQGFHLQCSEGNCNDCVYGLLDQQPSCEELIQYFEYNFKAETHGIKINQIFL